MIHGILCEFYFRSFIFLVITINDEFYFVYYLFNTDSPYIYIFFLKSRSRQILVFVDL